MQRAYWDDEVSILSSENVFFQIETAGLAARFAAVLLDMTLQLLVLALLTIAGSLFTSYFAPIENWTKWMIYSGGAISILLAFLILYAYYFFFEWLWDGQTPGKRALRLRVMQTNGMPITYWHALVRNVLRIADFLPLMYGAGAVVALFDSNNRRAGDLIAGTIVARERGDLTTKKVLDIESAVEAFLSSGLPLEPAPVQSAAPAAIAAEGSTPFAAPEAQTTDSQPETDAEVTAMLRRMDAQDYELARDFLIRRDKLPEATRLRLSQSLASRLHAKLGESTPFVGDAEAFLNEIVMRLRGRF